VGIAVMLLLASGVAPRLAESWSSSVSAPGSAVVGSFGLQGARVDVKPETLQLGSHGDHVTAFIKLLDADVRAIDVSTVRLCVGISPCGDAGVPATDPIWTQGGHVLKVRFAKEGTTALLSGVTPPADVVLTVSGSVAGRSFAGSDVVRVIGSGSGGPGPNADPTPSASPSEEPSPSATPAPSASPSG
jgi:hypothetical protein